MSNRRTTWFLRHAPQGVRSARVGPMGFALAATLASLACQTQSSTSSDSGVGQTRQAVEAAPDTVDSGSPALPGAPIAATPAAAAAAASVDVGVPVTTITRLTADGEPAVAQVPAAASSVEVPEGAPCGVVDANGMLQSCQPGTYCLSEGGTATCVKAPAAPRWDG